MSLLLWGCRCGDLIRYARGTDEKPEFVECLERTLSMSKVKPSEKSAALDEMLERVFGFSRKRLCLFLGAPRDRLVVEKQWIRRDTPGRLENIKYQRCARISKDFFV